LKQGLSEKVPDFLSEQVICRYGTPESVVADSRTENKKWTDLFLKQ
jgi:hypothetical protein